MLKFLIATGSLLFATAAFACTCGTLTQSGFVHAGLKRLPANAKGALFLPPPLTQEQLLPSAFSITSDAQPGLLPAALSWPNFNHQVNDAQRLVRIAPAEGFKPGVRYRIRYNKQVKGWAYANEVEFTIDDTALTQADLNIQLQLDGQPQQQMLALATGRGSCTHEQPVKVQAFGYSTPAALQPYSSGITYFAESRPEAGGEFAQVRYEPSICGERDFGATANPHGQDLIYTDCDNNDSPRILRGWAGFLEVEDELRLVGTQNIDLDNATGRACTGFNVLKKALLKRDKQHVRDIACDMPLRYDGEYFVPPGSAPRAIALADLPPLEDLYKFSDEGDAEDQRCVRRVLWRLVVEAPTAAQSGAGKLGELLAALPPDEREHKILAINDLLGELDTLQDRKDIQRRLDALLKPLLPTLRETAKLKSPAAKAARNILKRSKN